jgi:cytochrome c5
LNRDKKAFSTYTLALGVLGAAAIVILVVAIKMSGERQDEFSGDAEAYRAAVEERIRPLGEVYRPGQELAHPTIETAVEPEPVATLMTGPQVYNGACIACHGNGVGGAPIVGDVEEWAPRIAQGTDTLHDHAINGFTGSAGVMIAKGGRLDLSDGEIADAVDYMVDESR